MRATGSIQNIMETTLETIKGSIDANTIIGDPIKTDTTVVVPISKVTIGFGIGGGEYSNIINLTEERIKIHEPIFVEKNRFRAMLNPMLCCVYILYGKSKKYIEKNV